MQSFSNCKVGWSKEPQWDFMVHFEGLEIPYDENKATTLGFNIIDGILS